MNHLKVFSIVLIALWCIFGVTNGKPQDEGAAPSEGDAIPPVPQSDPAPVASSGGDQTCTEENGNYKHESDCNKYFVCDNKKRIDRQCQAGLNFDAANNRCDWAANVPC